MSEALGAACRSCGMGEWECNPIPVADLDGVLPECCENCDHSDSQRLVPLENTE